MGAKCAKCEAKKKFKFLKIKTGKFLVKWAFFYTFASVFRLLTN